MPKLSDEKVRLTTDSLLACVAFVLLSVPAFNMTGRIVKPLLLCVIGSAAIALVLKRIPHGETVCGISLLMFVSFWLVFAVIKELELQYEHGFPGKWIYFFYFDKLLMVGTIWLSAVSVFLVSRLFFDNVGNYKAFYRTSSAAFVVFYIFLLIYSFVLIRLERGVYPMDWVPFNTIKEYISDYASIPYEVFMMFFGNLLYFTPLGIIFYLLLKKHSLALKLPIFLIFPVAAFSLLEYSQYIFQNGFCEFDDMLMNSAGFWLGGMLGRAADMLTAKATDGRINCFWG